jgi:hypothetical protein
MYSFSRLRVLHVSIGVKYFRYSTVLENSISRVIERVQEIWMIELGPGNVVQRASTVAKQQDTL